MLTYWSTSDKQSIQLTHINGITEHRRFSKQLKEQRTAKFWSPAVKSLAIATVHVGCNYGKF